MKVDPQVSVVSLLENTEVYIINLDESRHRWIQCFRKLSAFFPSARIHRVPAIDGRTFTQPGEPSLWNPAMRRQLQREGYLADTSVLDPIRTALCLSHQRALRQFLHDLKVEDEDQRWALIIEDDAQPAEALLRQAVEAFAFTIPPDADLLFLHDRVLTSAPVSSSSIAHDIHWRSVIGGIGLEAYLVSRRGADKILQAWRPLHFECDVQLMTFVRDYADHAARTHVWEAINKGQDQDPFRHGSSLIHCYAPQRPLFQINESLPSVKLELLAEIAPPEGSANTSENHVARSRLTLDRSQPLAFATCWFNPCHYRSRLENLLRFLDSAQGANLVVVELAFGDDDWQLPDNLPNLVRLRSDALCWQKEALLNHALALLDQEKFPYLGWLDADILFQNADWQPRLLDALQAKRLCQVFETVDTTFPDRGPTRSQGAAVSWMKHALHPVHCQVPGFGWAMHREVWAHARLFDLNILGGGDGTMWRGAFYDYLCEKRLFSIGPHSPSFATMRRTWAKKWSSSVGMKIGYAAKVRITSLPHGRGKDRQYITRHKRLVQHVFDPHQHVSRDGSGLLQWHPDTPAPLRSTVSAYFTSRQEDNRN